MANIRKQFNFRNGVQVDDDNLVVSPTGLVGIGTTVPTELLHVSGGNARVTGFLTASQLRGQTLTVFDTGTIENIEIGNTLIGAGISIRSGFITATDPSGIVTYYGDARFLQGLPTSQWLDIDAGLGFTSIYNRGFVGIATDDPRFTLQVAGGISTTAFHSGVGIHSSGDIFATGIVTALSYTGIGSELTLLNATNIELGTISNDRLPVLLNSKFPNDISVGGTITASSGFIGDIIGNLTGDVTGNVTGIATGAEGLVGSPDITVGILTASAVAASSFIGGITGNVTGTASTAASLTSDADVDIDDLTVGVATVSSILSATSIGVGTDSELTSDITIRKTGAAILQLTSGINTTSSVESLISIGSTTSLVENSGGIRYSNASAGYPYSLYESLDLINFGNGNINYYLQGGIVGPGTGNFNWHHTGANNLMSLTYEGNLGVGKTDPTAKLEVTGLTSTSDLFVQNDVQVSGNIAVDGDISVPGAGSSITTRAIYIQDGSSGLLKSDGTEIIPPPGEGFNSLNITGVSTVGDLYVDGKTTISSDHTTGGGLSINPVTYRQPIFAAMQVGHPLDFNTQEPLGIGTTAVLDQRSVDEITLIDGGQVGIGTTALDEFNSLTVYGSAVIERLGIGMGVTEMTTGVLNIKGPVFVSEGTPDEGILGGPSADIRTTGIVTALNGFCSGIGTGIQMNVVGTEIQFTVPGVGTTSLSLF